MPSDNVRLDGDPSGLIRALDRATQAWNAYNRNLVRNIELSQQVANVTVKLTAAFNNYTGAARDVANQQQRVSRNLSNTNRSLNAAANNTERLTSATASYRGQAAAMNAALGRTARGANEASANASKLSVSISGMARLVGVQLMHRAISGMARALAEGVRESIEIQKSLSEVRTISQNNQQTLEQWRQGVKALSNAYGVDLRDQIEGTYQALSNQIAEGADTIRFLADSNKFAAASASSTTEAVQLLTGALNAYGLEASHTDQVAAQFFKTIELGRVRASDMANSFGDIAIVANQLGLGLDETQAAVSTLTIRGVAYNKAATQLRGIFVKLLKPTEKMKEFFRELGVNSGEAAIKAYGFDGVLQKLNESTKGSATELAKYINRVRGLSGALALSNEGLETYKDNLDKIRGSTESYGKAVDEVLNNSGKRADIFLKTIKNFFLEQGNTIVEFYANWAAENTKFFKHAEEERERLASANKVDAEVDKVTNAYEKGMKDRLKLYDRETADYNAALNQRTNDTAAAYGEIQVEADRLNKAILRGINDQVSESNKRLTELTKNVADAAKQIVDITREGEKTLFDWGQAAKNTAEKIKGITERIGEIRLKQSAAFVTGDKKAFDAYNKELRKLFVERKKLDDQLSKDNIKALEKQRDLNREITKARADGIAKESTLRLKLRGSAPGARAGIEKQIFENARKTEQKVSELRTKLKSVVTLDQQKLKHVKDYTAELERQKGLYGELAETQKVQAAAESKRVFNQELQRDHIKDLFKQYRSFKFGDAATETDPEKLRKTVQERQKLIDQILTVGGQLGVDTSAFLDLDKAVGIETKTLIQRAQLIEAQVASRKSLTEAIKNETEALKAQAEVTKNTFKDDSSFKATMAKLKSEYTKFHDLVQKTQSNSNSFINVDELERALVTLKHAMGSEDPKLFAKRMREAAIEIRKVSGTHVFNTRELELQAQQAVIKAKSAKVENEVFNEVNKKYEEAKKLVERIKKENIVIKDTLGAQARGLGYNLLTTQQLVKENEKILQLYRDQNSVILQRSGAGSGGREGGDVPITQAFGDIMSGSDNRVALRNAGEGVINAKNTRRFYSQLVAMNASPQSVVTGGGGNTTVGDISVTMQASGNLNYDMASLGKNIKRAARRGLV